MLPECGAGASDQSVNFPSLHFHREPHSVTVALVAAGPGRKIIGFIMVIVSSTGPDSANTAQNGKTERCNLKCND